MDISREHAIISFAYALQYTISIDFFKGNLHISKYGEEGQIIFSELTNSILNDKG